MEIESGSFRIHTPEGFVYTNFNPTPWREIWQGVSGFNAHFILIFDGGIPITKLITVTFKESSEIKRAVELYKDLKAQEKAKTRSQEELNEANRRITDGANYVILGKIDLSRAELDKAESILTGKTVEEIISEKIEDTQPDVGAAPPVSAIYVIGAAVVILVLILLLFGKNILSLAKGGKKDE